MADVFFADTRKIKLFLLYDYLCNYSFSWMPYIKNQRNQQNVDSANNSPEKQFYLAHKPSLFSKVYIIYGSTSSII